MERKPIKWDAGDIPPMPGTKNFISEEKIDLFSYLQAAENCLQENDFEGTIQMYEKVLTIEKGKEAIKKSN